MIAKGQGHYLDEMENTQSELLVICAEQYEAVP